MRTMWVLCVIICQLWTMSVSDRHARRYLGAHTGTQLPGSGRDIRYVRFTNSQCTAERQSIRCET